MPLLLAVGLDRSVLVSRSTQRVESAKSASRGLQPMLLAPSLTTLVVTLSSPLCQKQTHRHCGGGSTALHCVEFPIAFSISTSHMKTFTFETGLLPFSTNFPGHLNSNLQLVLKLQLDLVPLHLVLQLDLVPRNRLLQCPLIGALSRFRSH